MDNLIEDHNTEFGRVFNHSFAFHATNDNSVTHPADYKDTFFANFITELTSYRSVIKRRIVEISNRIGYVNGKDVAYFKPADPTNPVTKSSGYNTAYGAFAGYAFNSGNGYANTVYSHANFLAGKKINLFGKVLKAIVGVQAMYDEVTKKRSEYYEYNQAI